MFNEAFAHFKLGNDLGKTRFNLRDLKRQVELRIKFFDRVFAAAVDASPIALSSHLIFIVGMPRSGTTLVEQILASHPDAYAGGERRDINNIVERLSAQLKSLGPYPLCLRGIDRGLSDRTAAAHLTRVERLAGGASRFVDKAPANFFEIGLIFRLFPGAKIVHCQRDPLDTCLSCYFQNFAEIDFANDLEILGLYYRQYKRLMEHWHSIFPGRIFDLQNEELVDSPAVVIRELLAYCNLSWNSRCLASHLTNRAVLTPSTYQVKSPINPSSVGRWKIYKKFMHNVIVD